MPNIIDANGLQINTAAETTSALVAGAQGIYGADINVDQNSPDGQTIGIAAQAVTDLLEFIASVNAGFDPDQAIGAVLDQRVVYNNIARNGGTYTVQPIDITVTSTVTLQGLDGNFSNPNGAGYTVQDGSGNQFILSNTVTLTAGTTTVDFRAQQIGTVNVPVNTITVPVTIVLGVTSVNNSSAAITIGAQQETDPQLRTRRDQSVALATTGYLNGLQGKLLALPGVTEAKVYDNRSNVTDANGIPGHNIWVIVAGGNSTDIGNTVYNTINGGPGMKGAIDVDIITPAGALFVAQYDTPVSENLYIEFTIKTTIPGYNFALTAIANYIAANQTYKIGQFAETSSLTATAAAAIAAQGGGGVALDLMISIDDSTWTDFLQTTTLNSQFTIDPTHINITVVT